MAEQKTRLLKQKETGHIYVWTEALSIRKDMEEIEARVEKAAAKQAPVVLEADDPAVTGGSDEDQKLAEVNKDLAATGVTDEDLAATAKRKKGGK
jgi:hypothetical protein